MALNVGELVATLDADPRPLERGLGEAELAMHGFQRSADGRLRTVDGRFASMSRAAEAAGAATEQAARASQAAANEVAAAAEHARAAGEAVATSARTAQDAMGRLVQDAQGRWRTVDGRFATMAERAAAGLGEGPGVAGSARHAERAANDLKLGLGRLASGLGGVAVKMAPLLTGLGSAVPLAAGLATTLAQIAPAGAVAATGILTVITASATLKLAMHGVGDAVKAAFDPGTKAADLKKALDGLAPSARGFVLQLRAMRPELHSLQQTVQQRFFSGLAADMKDLGRSALPTVRANLAAAAGAFNIMGHGVIQTATALADSGTLGRALKGATAGLTNLAGIPAMVVSALGQVAAVAAPTFARLTASAGAAAERVSDKLNKAFASGGMSQAIDIAVGVLRQLGAVLGNIGSIVGSVFGAANTAGGSWLGVLKDITAAAATAFASPAVQSALGALFKTMRTLGQTVGPLVAQALGAIAPVLTALGPAAQVLIKALGAGLRPIIAGLKPVLAAAAQAVAALVIGLSPLLPIVGDLIGQLVPVLMPVLKSLTPLFGQLAGPIKQLGQALGQALTPIITALGDSLAQIVGDYLPIFASLIKQGTALIPTLTPVLVQLGESIGQILAAVLPLMPQIQLLSVQLVTQLLPAILPLIPLWTKMEVLLLRLSTHAITGVAIPALQGLIAFLRGMQAMLSPGIAAVKWLVNGMSRLFEWLSDHLVGHSVIPDMVKAIVVWLAKLPILGVAAVAALPGRLAGIASSAAGRMVSALSRGVSSSARAVGRLPGMAKSALGGLGSYLYRSGQSLIRGFADGIRSMAGAVKSAAGSVLSKASDLFPHSPAKEGPFSGRGYPLYSGRAIGAALAAGMLDTRSAVAAAAATLAGSAHPGFGLGLPGSGAIGVSPMYSGSGSSGTPQKVVVQLDVTGGDHEFVKLIRSWVNDKGGGNVQRAFGR